MNKVEDELKKNAEEFGDKHGIYREVLELIEFYINTKKDSSKNN